MSILNEFFTLSNGVKMPKIGLGTYKLASEDTYSTILEALKIGVRHFDTAIIYRNEKSIGEAIRDSGVLREDIFITSKLPPHVKNHAGALRMFEKSLKNLNVEYIDLYIINAPGPFNDLDGDYDEGNVEVYKTLEQLYREKRVKAIGVSQFKIKDIENILAHCEIVPHVQQISYFIGHTQKELVDYCKNKNIQIQAFSPLAKGYLLNNQIVLEIAEAYQTSPSQIALKYIIQNNVAPIPKARKKEHILLNTELNFTIEQDDMNKLNSILDDPRKYDD